MTDYETEPFPPLRASSPSPSIPPTPAISSCTSPDRTFSTVSSHSAYSASSATSADGKSSGSVSSRRRGYIRPQGAEFADSARHRESVMSLGSIAHLQYYFARTGLLDGKGAQAREFRKKKHEEVPKLLLTPNARYIPEDMADSPTATDDEILGPQQQQQQQQQQQDDDGSFEDSEDVMLPPTVSTYSIKTYHIPPPPDLPAMRRDLLEAVERAEREIQDIGSQTEPPADLKPPRISLSPDDSSPETEEDILRQIMPFSRPQAWHELQGMRILDVVTLAIRAARIYYTAHERPERLATVKSEREIRQALFHVLELLKRWASRNFSGGLRDDERTAIMTWMSDVRTMLAKERDLEDSEAKERSSWTWAHGDWTGREREREDAFLHSLVGSAPSLPPWTSTETTDLPTPLLQRLSDGRDLVCMHNWAVKKSKRPFCEIKSYHEDIAKPYRRAENIRFWVKAAEIRWETKLEFDVMGVVSGNNDAAWRQFDAALLKWCRVVREELTRDWWSTPAATVYPN